MNARSFKNDTPAPRLLRDDLDLMERPSNPEDVLEDVSAAGAPNGGFTLRPTHAISSGWPRVGRSQAESRGFESRVPLQAHSSSPESQPATAGFLRSSPSADALIQRRPTKPRGRFLAILP